MQGGPPFAKIETEDLTFSRFPFPQGMRLIWLANGTWDSINGLMFQQREVSTVHMGSGTELRTTLTTHVMVLSISAMDQSQSGI